MRLPLSHVVVYQGCTTFTTEGPSAIKQIRPRPAPSFHTGCLVLVTGIKIHFVVLHLARGPQVAHPCRTLQLMQVRQLHQTGNLHHKYLIISYHITRRDICFALLITTNKVIKFSLILHWQFIKVIFS